MLRLASHLTVSSFYVDITQHLLTNQSVSLFCTFIYYEMKVYETSNNQFAPSLESMMNVKELPNPTPNYQLLRWFRCYHV